MWHVQKRKIFLFKRQHMWLELLYNVMTLLLLIVPRWAWHKACVKKYYLTTMPEINYYDNRVKCHCLCSNQHIIYTMIYLYLLRCTFYSHYFMISFLLIDYSSVSNHIDSKRLNALVYSKFVPMHTTQAISVETL